MVLVHIRQQSKCVTSFMQSLVVATVALAGCIQKIKYFATFWTPATRCDLVPVRYGTALYPGATYSYRTSGMGTQDEEGQQELDKNVVNRRSETMRIFFGDIR
eukprot:scaffold53780_cov20-Prasinocladus_malaysianus.AAC.1